jgi:3-oxoacyl-[acyl-carrier protein] reductase
VNLAKGKGDRDRKVVLITGASSGIGRAVALRLAAEGMRVALAARRLELLQETAAEIMAGGGEAFVAPTDLRSTEEIHRLVKSTLAQWGQIDVLVNNAGVIYDRPLVAIKPEQLREEVATNLTAVIECSQAVLPAMVRRGSGHIINVSSVAGLIGLPGMSLYSATKFGVIGFSEALMREVHRYHIRVTAFCPGYVMTNFSPFLEKVGAGEKGVHKPAGLMNPEYIAKRIAQVIHHPSRQVILPYFWSLLAAGARMSPEIASHIVPWFIP